MSRRAQATLLGAVLFSTLTIWGVHYMQDQERETMYQGVLRDDERRLQKMRQRQAELEESQRKREVYERVQRVSAQDTASEDTRLS
ncbi:hypothetical protein PUNSTDRAFT_101340 [Punctularia strigosozonata HHB-11173 SS5]|uniref:uncharacterized protein n=1 Tax=Punctularia strigosozonata (strain HHB-11173) TaxID=741275 RepID=UPI0004416B4A|nr:uncharacterized protein PUNSTDRAFT_101340 [Punctularia strigosozonata HHB-11173 SS5]EIN09504.1 hypothetical protein PUNSTDRAFT_101340 [Punctularia strigosozonata HHB-11173 SS5]